MPIRTDECSTAKKRRLNQFGAANAIRSTVSVELLSNLTKTRQKVRRLNQIAILVVGCNNLTVFETTSIGSVLVKESRPPTSFRPARLALVVCHSCDDIGIMKVYNPFLTLKI